jgi:hypothetical protein
MAKQQNIFRGMVSVNVLEDMDWVTVIGALLYDRNPESQSLAKRLLQKTKHGRQVRLVKLIQTKKPNTDDMAKALKMSRRTIFRYLNGLEDYGMKLTMDDDFRYSASHLPASFKRVLPRVDV